MKLKVAGESLGKAKAEVLTFAVFEGVGLPKELQKIDSSLGSTISKIIKLKKFSGKRGETYVFQTYGKIAAESLLLIGVGKKEEFELDHVRNYGGLAVKSAKALKAESLAISIPSCKEKLSDVSHALAEACVLADYVFDDYVTKEDIEKSLAVSILSGDKNSVDYGLLVAESINYTRQLQNFPPAVVTPAYLASEAQRMGKELKLKVSVLGKKELEKKGMNGILAVGRGSVNEPRLIQLDYNGGKKGEKPVILVGKGITFDTGGISIKPSRALDEMKFDMSGAAAILGIIRIAAKSGLKRNLIGLMACAENRPSASAYLPGDIIKSYNKKTIEVLNTDAEGRIVLSDALGYAAEMKSEIIIDIATLTGAVVVALGSTYSGMVGNSQKHMDTMKKAGERTGDKVWQMPIHEDYREMVKSKIADVKNIGSGKGEAGSLSAAAFLEAFVGESKWVHLDIAGTAWTTEPKPYFGLGGTGAGVHVISEFLRTL
ncbi:MAG: leucyl aminopeptidase [archaeon]|jgi:leucyl aminopeptidase|nr:leucyl aminopeptidase [archaeon]